MSEGGKSKEKADNTSLLLNSSSPSAYSRSQKASMDQGSTGANNVDAVPSPAGGARHRASSVCSPQSLSLKGSLLCQLGSEGVRSHCCNGRNQPVNLCEAHSVSSVRSPYQIRHPKQRRTKKKKKKIKKRET